MGQALDVSEGTVFRLKRRFAEDGLDGALQGRPQANQYTGSWMTGQRPT